MALQHVTNSNTNHYVEHSVVFWCYPFVKTIFSDVGARYSSSGEAGLDVVCVDDLS